MSNFNKFLTFDSKSAYDFAYDLSIKKNYSSPKIYTANGDLRKRWYVYFSYRNPDTGKLKRVTPIYGIANKFKTKEERMSVLVTYRKKVLELLKKGYSPLSDNKELYHKDIAKNENVNEVVVVKDPLNEKVVQEQIRQTTLKDAFDFAIKLKESLISASTKRGYESRVNKFIVWMKGHHPNCEYVEELTKGQVIEFLNAVLTETSPRNRNNYRVDLASLFQTLEDNEIVKQNFIRRIPVLRTKPKRNKTYSRELQKEIFKYLEEKDPDLLLYIKFVSYNFLRPIEVNRLKIGDINLEDRTIQFKAKNSPLKTKIIPDVLLKELPDLSEMNPNHYLFTLDKIGGEWETNEDNKRDYFSKRFKKVVKDHFNLGQDYGLYSFRHTFITKLYREIRKTTSPNEAKSHLMLITGHSSMSALEKYLRDIDAELPEDYSALIKS